MATMTATKKFIHIPPVQFEMMSNGRPANCLGYAFGRHEEIGLPYKGISISQSFRATALHYGIHVREVQNMSAIKNHKAFLVYGFYKMPDTLFCGCRIKGEVNDFHVVYVTAYGMGFHKPDAYTNAQYVEINPITGGIPEYEEGPAAIFVIEE